MYMVGIWVLNVVCHFMVVYAYSEDIRRLKLKKFEY